jgi:general secretion pathway protein A
MYAEYYKLSGKPFQLSPNPKFYFASEGHQKALAYLRYGLHQGEGFIVVTGDVGTGKTTLLGHLLDQLDNNEYLAAKLVSTQVGADDTLRLVASAFGIESTGVDKASLLREFEHFLLDNQRRRRRVLMLVDEVQNLPIKSLEELRMLSNFQSNDIAPIQFCLLGQPQFQRILASEDLMQLRQRVIASYHLGPLGPDETRGYIEHRLRLVDWQADPVISDGAFQLIHRYTSGVPRKINTLCDRLLLFGMLEDRHRIDE